MEQSQLNIVVTAGRRRNMIDKTLVLSFNARVFMVLFRTEITYTN